MPKGRKKGFASPNKTIFSNEAIAFIKDNFHKMKNPELAKALNIRLTVLRNKTKEMGLMHIELEYWDEYEVAFLQNNYREMGDTEIAELLQIVSPKKKGWTRSHISKKRGYLNLKRSKEEMEAVIQRNISLGFLSDCPRKMWDTIGRAKVGEVRVWKTSYKAVGAFVVIKTETGFVHYAPWLYEKHFGEIPKGYIVSFKDRDSLNVVPGNLELITRAGLAIRNRESYSVLDPEMKEAISLINKLNKKIKQHGKHQTTK